MPDLLDRKARRQSRRMSTLPLLEHLAFAAPFGFTLEPMADDGPWWVEGNPAAEELPASKGMVVWRSQNA